MSEYKTPKLPEGYFFRVGPEEGYFIGYGFGVSLRKKTWYGNKVILRSLPLPVDKADKELLQGEMEALAIFADLDKKIANNIKAKIQKLSGDYPPKEL